MEPATKSQSRDMRLLVPGFVFVVLYGGARFALAMATLPPPWPLAVALVPVPAFVMFMVACFRVIGSLDELQRLIQLKALAFAFPASLVLVLTLGLLEKAITLPPEDLSYRHVWAMMPIFYYLGLWLAQRRFT